jgi:acyl carrier protein
VLIDQVVGQLLVVHLGVDRSRIVGPARLDEDLGLDSLSLTEALLLLEDELAISIPEPVQLELRTYADLVSVVASQITATAGSVGRNPAPGDSFSRQLDRA